VENAEEKRLIYQKTKEWMAAKEVADREDAILSHWKRPGLGPRVIRKPLFRFMVMRVLREIEWQYYSYCNTLWYDLLVGDCDTEDELEEV